jgi:predicted PurR-regulated permease PerM
VGSRAARFVAVLIGVVVVVWAIITARGVVTPFLLAFALAYALNPLVNALERAFGRILPRRRGRPLISPRPAAVGVLFALVVAAVLVIVLVGIPAAFHQASDAVQKLPADVESLRTKLEPKLARLSERYPQQAQAIREQLSTFAKDNMGSIVERVTHFVQSTVLGAFSVAAGAIGVLILPIFTAFLLYDMNHIREDAKELVPLRLRSYAYSRMDQVDARVAAFVRGQLTVCLIMTVYYSIVLTLCGVPVALLIALLMGIFHLIPFMPTVLGLPLVGLLALIDSQNFRHAGLVIGVAAVGQFVEANIITPKIVGHGVGLHPVIVLLSVLVGGELFGIIGMLVGVPATAALSVFWTDFRSYYLQSDFYRSNPDDTVITPPER